MPLEHQQLTRCSVSCVKRSSADLARARTWRQGNGNSSVGATSTALSCPHAALGAADAWRATESDLHAAGTSLAVERYRSSPRVRCRGLEHPAAGGPWVVPQATDLLLNGRGGIEAQGRHEGGHQRRIDDEGHEHEAARPDDHLGRHNLVAPVPASHTRTQQRSRRQGRAWGRCRPELWYLRLTLTLAQAGTVLPMHGAKGRPV